MFAIAFFGLVLAIVGFTVVRSTPKTRRLTWTDGIFISLFLIGLGMIVGGLGALIWRYLP